MKNHLCLLVMKFAQNNLLKLLLPTFLPELKIKKERIPAPFMII